MQLLVTVQDTGDTEIAQHQLLMFLITEEEIAGFDILMDDVTVVTIGQRSSCLKSYTAELVEVAIQIIVAERTTTQVFHQLIVTVLPVNIGLTVIQNLHDSLHAETLDNAHERLLDGEVGIVYLQHHLLPIALYLKHLCLT